SERWGTGRCPRIGWGSIEEALHPIQASPGGSHGRQRRFRVHGPGWIRLRDERRSQRESLLVGVACFGSVQSGVIGWGRDRVEEQGRERIVQSLDGVGPERRHRLLLRREAPPRLTNA